jgi:protein arginine kinase activator
MGIACQRCNKARATVHLTDLDQSGESHQVHFCDACAAAEGITASPQEPINAILAKFIGTALGQQTEEEVSAARCPECGITLKDFRQHGLLGCPNDYKVFAPFLKPLIERAHEGAKQHIGHVPRQAGATAERRTSILRLRRQLSEAVEREDYKLAAQIKHQIEDMEKV